MKDSKQEAIHSDPTQGPAAGARKAEKVRSSRYEWETKTEPKESQGAPGEGQRSLMASVRSWLRIFFSTSRSFFDKDDDPTPSAA